MDQITPAPTIAAAASGYAKVFVSYSRKDLPFAQMLVAALVERGFDAFLDKTDIAPGEPWKERLAGLIAAADTVVFVVSPDLVASSVCAWELEESGRLSKRLIPIVARRIADLDAPALLGRLNWVFCGDGDDRDAALTALDTALHTDLDWVREHTRLGEMARRWNDKGRSGSATLRGADLDAAERWLDRRPADANAPTDLHQDFIRASRRAQSRRRNILTGSLAAGLLAALVLAGLAYWQRGIAVEQRDKALLRQSQFLADVASRRITRGDSVNAMALGIEALPDTAAGVDRPYSVAAEAALFNAERHRQEQFVFAPPGWTTPPGGGAIFSPDGHLRSDAVGEHGARGRQHDRRDRRRARAPQICRDHRVPARWPAGGDDLRRQNRPHLECLDGNPDQGVFERRRVDVPGILQPGRQSGRRHRER